MTAIEGETIRGLETLTMDELRGGEEGASCIVTDCPVVCEPHERQHGEDHYERNDRQIRPTRRRKPGTSQPSLGRFSRRAQTSTSSPKAERGSIVAATLGSLSGHFAAVE
jgi:hypothetical protein